MKKIEDYLHLYIPFRFMWVEDAVPFKKGETGLMDAEGLQYWDNFKKPILRKLSDMSEEEKRQSRSMAEIGAGLITIESMAKITNYFRENSLDIDGLIEDGLAIDKTTLTT